MTDTQQPDIPDRWQLAEIRKIAEVNPQLDKSAFADSLTVSFVPMAAVEAGTGGIDVSQTRRFGKVKKGYTPFRQGDILFAKITPCMENGKTAVVPALTNGVGFGSTEFHVLRPYGAISSEFIYYFLSSEGFRRDAAHHMTGAVGQRRVPTSYLAEYPIPLPPAREQTRIVSKIEELFSELHKGIASLTTAREQLKVYRQAVLKQAFEGRLTAEWRRDRFGDHDASWQSTELGDVLSLVTSGSRGWASYYSGSGDIFIRAQNLKHDRLDLDDVAHVDLPAGKANEGTRTRVQVGDVLVTITGANVTKTGLVSSDIGTAYVNQHVALLRPTDALCPEFLYWYLVAEAGGRRQLKKAAYGAGKPGLNLGNLKSVIVPIPSTSEQAEIVARIRNLLSVADHVDLETDQQLQRSEVLRRSILRTAFSGRLVPEDPADEPAVILLARIQSDRQEPLSNSRKRKTG